MDIIVIANVALTVAGVLMLLIGLGILWKYINILDTNSYSTRRWFLVGFMIVMFILGYTLNLLVVLIDFRIIDPVLVVSLVYFFGAIYVLITASSMRGTIVSILGDTMSDDDAITLFNSVFELELPTARLKQQYNINCEHCDTVVPYTIPDIVRSNAVDPRSGISIMSTFGVRSFVLRPTHKCNEERRELTVIHDENLEFRSLDQSRIILGGFR